MKLTLVLFTSLAVLASLPAPAAAVKAGPARVDNVAFVSAVNLQSERVAACGQTLLTAFNNLSVVDTIDPSALRLINRYKTDFIYDLEVDGETVFAAQQDFGLRSIDVSVGVPTLLGSRPLGGSVYGLDLADRVLYAANGKGGLVLIDAARPADLPELSRTDTGGMALDAAAGGGYAYVANGLDGLRVYDVRDKSRPVEVARLDTPGSASDVTLAGTILYLADGAAGLRILNVSNPAAPLELAVYDTPGSVERTVIDGGYAYVADRQAGLIILDVSDPAKPVKAGSYDSPGGGWDVTLIGGYIYLADYPHGTRVLKFIPPAGGSPS